MKTIRLLLLTIIINQVSIANCSAQAGEWTWMGGDSTPGMLGTYGIKGVPSPSNTPGARYAGSFWTDSAGNFWIYGGSNAPGDMWKFDLQTVQWTWMEGDTIDGSQNISASLGQYSVLNSPGPVGYGVFNWHTADDHFWLYAGWNDSLNDVDDNLWQYDPAINEWAWMGTFGFGVNHSPNYGTKGQASGSNGPGGRQEGNSCWTDSAGNLWLFGGNDYTNDAYNDVWQYNVSTGLWTWMSGSANINDPGSYGVIGQSSPNNYPSGRSTNLFWKDSSGNFWLAGGNQFHNSILYQDIWKFDPATLQWTWINGIQGADASLSGINCMADTNNHFGARYENRSSWQICDDLILTYGGIDRIGGLTWNDLWAYQVSQNEWIKINSWGTQGNYGVKGIANATNYPLCRFGSIGFKDKNNNVWIYGGIDGVTSKYCNDLWKYVLDTACVQLTCNSRSCNLAPPLITAPDSIFCMNDSIRICAITGFASYQWSNGITGNANCIEANSPGTYYVMVTDSTGCRAQSNAISLSFTPPPADSITTDKNIFCATDSTQICALPGFILYHWNTGANTITNCIEANTAGDYYVMATDSAGCTANSNHLAISVYPSPGVSISVHGDMLTVFNAVSEQWYLDTSAIANATDSVYIAIQSGSYTVEISDTNGCTAISNPVVITGINNLSEPNIALIPNPTNDKWQLTVDNSLLGSKLEVFDDNGKTVYESQISNLKTYISFNAASGVYLLRISSGDVSVVRKLVKL